MNCFSRNLHRPPPRSASLETLVPTEDFSHPRRRKFTQVGKFVLESHESKIASNVIFKLLELHLQIYDKSDPLNPTDLRRRLEQVSKPLREVKSQEGKVSNEKQVDVEEKLKRETSESILDPLNKKIDNIAERLEKDENDAKANWEKSQRELEEVNNLNLHQSPCLEYP